MLLLYEDLTHSEVIARHSWAQTVAVWTLAASAGGLGWLMVSRLDYLHVFNMYVRRRRPPTHVLVLLVGFFTIVMLYPAALVLCCALLYVFSGFLLNLSRRWNRTSHEPGDAS